MLDPKKLDEVAKKISDAIPSGVKDLGANFEKNVKTIVHTAFDKLDLVTREEFDIQKKVLATTRKKIEALEKKLDTIEAIQAKK